MIHGGALDQILRRKGLVRTDMDCHGCRELGLPPHFIASIQHDLDGNHEIICPRCGHVHYRVVVNGIVTEERYNSGYPVYKSETMLNMWKAEDKPIVTSTAGAFIRDLWLNR